MNKILLAPFSSENLLQKQLEDERKSNIIIGCAFPALNPLAIDNLANPCPEDLLYYYNNFNNPLKNNYHFSDTLSEMTASKLLLTPNFNFSQYYKARLSNDNQYQNQSKLSIVFNSNFDSGNLMKVYKYIENEYILLLSPDYSNNKYSH